MKSCPDCSYMLSIIYEDDNITIEKCNYCKGIFLFKKKEKGRVRLS